MLVNDALLRIASGELKRLIVEMPPRHGKSQAISEYASGWFVAHGKRVILASYEADFASSWGAKSRNHLREHGHVFGVTVGPKDQEKWWECSSGGQMICAGVGGPITGKGFDIGIIDDPVKNAEEADSETYREKAKSWYDSTWVTRREPNAAEIIILTRWHEDDLAGYVMQRGDWERITLPAIAEEDDQMGRAYGEALCPARFPIEELLTIKSETPPRWWSALYQQRPVAEEGALFKRAYWQRYTTLPTPMRGCITVDTAGWQRTDTSADRCVLAAWFTNGVNFYAADVQKGHWEFTDVVRRAKDLHAKHNIPVVVEDVPWSKPLIDTLKREIPGVIAWPVAGKGSKENRARSVQHYAEGLNLYLPNQADWVSDFIEEHASFPNGTHDDQVDTTVMALMYLGKSSAPRTDVKANADRYKRTVGGRVKA